MVLHAVSIGPFISFHCCSFTFCLFVCSFVCLVLWHAYSDDIPMPCIHPSIPFYFRSPYHTIRYHTRTQALVHSNRIQTTIVSGPPTQTTPGTAPLQLAVDCTNAALRVPIARQTLMHKDILTSSLRRSPPSPDTSMTSIGVGQCSTMWDSPC